MNTFSNIRALSHLALAAGASICLAGCTVTFRPAYVAAPRTVAVSGSVTTTNAGDPELEKLVAPIALYPDPLIAQLLPAATYPDELKDAQQWLDAQPNPTDAEINDQPWAESVKAIVHYPDALKVLNNDPQWTQSLGSAFTNNQADVMAAIQDMREQAKASGSLVSTPQAQVVADGSTISIQPADPAVIYVPTYDPVVVYTSYAPITWGISYGVGPWLVTGVDWGGGFIFVGDWHGGWRFDHGHWDRDRAWHNDRFRHWGHDDRFGRAPRVERSHFATPRGVVGRETQFQRSMAQHNQIVHAHQQQVRQQSTRTPSHSVQRGNERGSERRDERR